MASSRLRGVLAHISQHSTSAPAASNSDTMATKLPTFDELPKFKDFTGCAWEVWGKDDQLGTVNLLTDEVVKEASKEIKYVFLSNTERSTLRRVC